MNCKKSFGLIVILIICCVLSFSLFVTGCTSKNIPQEDEFGGSGSNNYDNGTAAEVSDLPPAFDNNYIIDENTISISTDVNNGYILQNNIYTIKAAGTYSFSGGLANGQIIVDAGETSVVEIELKSVEIACDFGAPILILSADKVEISAKKDTENVIIDKRETCDDSDETKAAIYSKRDLKLKGNGMLSIKSLLNNGIHTKDDLDIKNLTLYVYAPNNAIKGNDSVTIENAAITAISTGGDAVKSNNSDLSGKGNQRGTVTIKGGTLDLYACCDGVDAAYDVVLSSDANLNIYTNTYSSYSLEKVDKSQTEMYIRFTENRAGGMRPGQFSSFAYSSYKYSVLFTLNDGSEVWENLSASKTNGAYIFYSLELPENASKFCLYAYGSSQKQQSKDSYTYSTDNLTVNVSYDTFYISGVSGGKLSGGWTNYSTTTQQGPGGFGGPGGGMNEGNLDSAEFSCKGIKAGNSITIDDCNVTIYAYDDAIHANNDVLLETGNYGQGNITINSGTLVLSSKDDAIHADQDFNGNGGLVTVKTSYEGIEANRIYFNGITSYVYSSDDAVNAAGSGTYVPVIEINAGYLDLETPSGDTDTMDSNGTIKIQGGIVILKNGQSGSSRTGGTIDCDGSVTVTDGTIIAIGAICNTISGSKQSSSATLNAGNYSFKDADGNIIAEFTLKSSHKGYMIYANSGTYNLFCEDSSILSISF